MLLLFQMKQLVASKNMTMKDLFVEHGRSISKVGQ